jgi:hypothetical protein
MTEDNSTGVLVALIGIVAAFALVFVGRGSASAAPAPGAVSRDEVVDGFQPSQSFFEELRDAASESSGSGSSTDGADGSDLSSDTAPGSPGFAQAIIERTGYLPSGFDAAGRIALNNRTDSGDGSAGFVGL